MGAAGACGGALAGAFGGGGAGAWAKAANAIKLRKRVRYVFISLAI